MSPAVQTLLSLVVVGITAIWLVRRAFRKDHTKGCGGGECGALSPEVKKLQRQLRR
ncbi:MAG: hypothetical protein IT582_01730 [Opitutaceae bacterium]|nr:hypothetical protein [Opitutaceae bacterium]